MTDTAALQAIVASDSRARGASALCRPHFWDDALRLCIRAPRILIVTGFYIRSARATETDGPPGAVALGRALAGTGKRVVLVTDSRNYDCLKACTRSIGGPDAACIDEPDKLFSRGALSGGDLLVFIERPGRAADGCYYNMKGTDIGDIVAPLDDAAEAAARRGVFVLGIGDGGNEAGMGALHGGLVSLMPNYASCLSTVPAHVCLPVDISNWGAYALTALLSAFYRRWLGLEENEEAIMLKALLEVGAVDGVTGVAGLSVDGVAQEELDNVSKRIRNWYFGRPNV